MSWSCERCDRSWYGSDQTPRCCDACLEDGWRMPFVDSSDVACGLAFDYGRVLETEVNPNWAPGVWRGDFLLDKAPMPRLSPMNRHLMGLEPEPEPEPEPESDD